MPALKELAHNGSNKKANDIRYCSRLFFTDYF